MSAKITIAITHYRSLGMLKRLFTELSKQNFITANLKNIQVVVVNDDIEEKIEASNFNRIKGLNLVVLNKKNMGVASARNRAIELAEGEIICFLDQDCYPEKNWLEIIVASFHKHKNIAGIGGHIKPFRGRNVNLVNEYYNIKNELERPIIDSVTKEIVAIITANCAFRTKTLREIGGFDECSFSGHSYGGEDVDLTYRLRKLGYKIIYEPLVMAKHEYPYKFKTIFKKHSNYGRGVKIFCLARGISPESIRQPSMNMFGFLGYSFNIFKKIKKSSVKFHGRNDLNFIKIVIFVFFDIIRYAAFGYGFFFKN